MATQKELILEAIRTEDAATGHVTRQKINEITGIPMDSLYARLSELQKSSEIFEDSEGLHVQRAIVGYKNVVQYAVDRCLLTVSEALDASGSRKDLQQEIKNDAYIQANLDELNELIKEDKNGGNKKSQIYGNRRLQVQSQNRERK